MNVMIKLKNITNHLKMNNRFMSEFLWDSFFQKPKWDFAKDGDQITPSQNSEKDVRGKNKNFRHITLHPLRRLIKEVAHAEFWEFRKNNSLFIEHES